MGSFGDLLEQHFGGTRHDVKTWGVKKEILTKGAYEIEDDKLLKKIVKTFNLLNKITKDDFQSDYGWQKFLEYQAHYFKNK